MYTCIYIYIYVFVCMCLHIYIYILVGACARQTLLGRPPALPKRQLTTKYIYIN